MAVQVPLSLVTHSRRVCSLYKKALRSLEDYAYQKYIFRYNAVLLRQRFEENRNIKDLRIAKKLVIDGEEELFLTQHPQPRQFASSPGGVAHARQVIPPDWVVDFWHPSEKAMYPHYFARREQRKKEYLEWYDKTYPDVKKNFKPPHH